MKLVNCKTKDCPCKVNEDSISQLCLYCRKKEKREAQKEKEKLYKYCIECHSKLKMDNESGYCFRCLKTMGRTRKSHSGFKRNSFYKELLEKESRLISLKEHIRLRDKKI